MTLEAANTNLTAGLHGYHPEMGEAKPQAQIEAHLAHYGKHYYLDTPLTLALGRGVKHQGVYKSSDLTPGIGQRRVGWNRYEVTIAAFDKIKAAHAVSFEMLLD